MYKIKNYRPCFDSWAYALFVLVMLPNVIWFALPERSYDVLRAQNVLPAADAVASIARVLIIVCLCFLKNTGTPPIRLRALTYVCALCVLAYYVMWALYFRGITAAVIVWGLCVFPCAAFILFSLDRKNLPALVFALVFTVCHALCSDASLRVVCSFDI